MLWKSANSHTTIKENWPRLKHCTPSGCVVSDCRRVNWHLANSHNVTHKRWNSALCIILIRTYRGQLWKGKQNKNSEEKTLKETAMVLIYDNYKISKAFSYWKYNNFWSLTLLMLKLLYKTPFQWCPLQRMRIQKHAFNCLLGEMKQVILEGTSSHSHKMWCQPSGSPALQVKLGSVNGTAHFKKLKQLLGYQHLLLLRDIW